MKYVISILIAFGLSSARADSFDVDWAKFSTDFEALNSRTDSTIGRATKKRSLQPAASKFDGYEVDGTHPEIGTSVETSLQESDKLGYQISHPEIRQKVLDLYRRPDVVVQQYVIPFN